MKGCIGSPGRATASLIGETRLRALRDAVELAGMAGIRIPALEAREKELHRVDDAIEAFRRILEDRNHRVTVRRSRGQDIGAACGQLEGVPRPGAAADGGVGTGGAAVPRGRRHGPGPGRCTSSGRSTKN